MDDRNPVETEDERSLARFLFSHHPPEHRHRTVCLGWRGGRYRICARCLGIAGGLILFVALRILGLRPPESAWLVLASIAGAALPAILDFHVQLMGSCESTNPRRILTGVAFGCALALSATEAWTARWPLAATLPVLLLSYFIWIACTPRGLARLLVHIERYAQHYDRCKAGIGLGRGNER